MAPVAGLGRRTAAAVVDLIVVVLMAAILGALFGRTEISEGNVSIRLEGASALLFFALAFAYFWLADARDGQTLGKALLGLRVAGTDGAPLGLGRAALRTALRIVDGLPVFYLVGFVTALATGEKRQRIGDLAADSRVVRNASTG